MINIAPIHFSASTASKYVNLFSESFPSSNRFNKQYLDWLYHMNPMGSAIGFDAWVGDDLVAHYACIPLMTLVEGVETPSLLSLNTATHPNFQGRGLFTKLAENTFDFAANLGFKAIFGVANSNSTPGFIKKLGFQLVQPLSAKFGFGSLGIDHSLAERVSQFQTSWSDEALKWRCNNPNNPIFIKKQNDTILLFAPAIGQQVHAYGEINFPNFSFVNFTHTTKSNLLSPFRIYIGLSPDSCPISRKYIDIPTYFRPSPLNFIYKSLSSDVLHLIPGMINFSFIDFDAY